MSKLSDAILEAVKRGEPASVISARTGCSIGYVSTVRQRFGLAKKYSVGNRQRILYLWIHEDKCARAIAKDTELPVEYVIEVILSHEKYRDRVKRDLKQLEKLRKDMVSYGI